MKSTRKWTILTVMFLLLSLFIVACGGGAATEEEPAADDSAATEEEAMDEPAAEEETAAEEEMAFEPMSVAAASCDYGGKISSIEAVDEYTVVFNLCKPDPAFLAKIAFTPFGIQPSEYIASTGGTGDILEKPIGTGPYMVDEWVRGDSIIYKRFDGH